MEYFEYGDTEINHLKEKDKILAAAMDELGHVCREVIPDLHSALILQIISQQISTKGAITIWNRLCQAVNPMTAEMIGRTDAAVIQACGMSMRKALYIKEFSRRVLDGTLDLDGLHAMPDDDVCAYLAEIKGIGVWTAEMLMTFSMQRPNVMSWGDIAIHRGLRMLYRHRRITRKLFDKYRRRYAPYASVACLYLWAIAGGECKGMTDPAPMSAAKKKAKTRRRPALPKKDGKQAAVA